MSCIRPSTLFQISDTLLFQILKTKRDPEYHNFAPSVRVLKKQDGVGAGLGSMGTGVGSLGCHLFGIELNDTTLFHEFALFVDLTRLLECTGMYFLSVPTLFYLLALFSIELDVSFALFWLVLVAVGPAAGFGSMTLSAISSFNFE